MTMTIEPRVYINELPPVFANYRALWLEYEELLIEQGVESLPDFKFCLNHPTGKGYDTYKVSVDWLKDKLIIELRAICNTITT